MAGPCGDDLEEDAAVEQIEGEFDRRRVTALVANDVREMG